MRTVSPEPVVDPYSARPWEPPVVVRRPRRVPLIHIVLFVCTFITTSMAGAFQVGANPFADPASIRAGFPFAVTLLSILLIHELGHYTLAMVHHVRATLPYFIPAPPVLIGTFGAFIRMKSPPANRRALFDVGAAGPWAGLIVAIPAVVIGLRLSEVRPLGLDEGGVVLGDSLLFSWLTKLVLGTTPDNVTILLHPIALAGWFGLFVTFLNLLPVGQLDGGHVAYALFGRWHRWIARLFLGVIAVLGFLGWEGWFVWVILLLVIGVDHPPTQDVDTPLDGPRRVAGWLTVGAFVLTFMSNPIGVAPPPPQFEGDRIPIAWGPPATSRRAAGGLVVPFHVAPRPAAPRAVQPRVHGVAL
jgi:membrane-associated protease RseP (regulator of RpoE activity)